MAFEFQKDPFELFEMEFKKAKDAGVLEPNAMSLATCSAQGQASIRTVLYKGMVRGGFSFFTNYNSPKAKDLLSTQQASLLFFWPSLQQQIRIQGLVEKLSRQESESYFASRPRLSQVGAWASQQSQEIASLSELQRSVDEVEAKYQGREIPCPPNWGGFHLLALSFEFWFGKEGRLHERYVFERQTLDSPWRRYLKSP